MKITRRRSAKGWELVWITNNGRSYTILRARRTRTLANLERDMLADLAQRNGMVLVKRGDWARQLEATASAMQLLAELRAEGKQ